ncbi:NTP transferase domain-containing protein [Vagococcus sp. DIV0080]|uniref:NTP transferase domain-containing protein n=1 Tax=Candidatus Vagococcus giribetii TaxID=2230876 RepID=A0ABS3HUC9_9ENTE|nr:NTP transferase domain-containing protein [Vagococcus sp. DIV0080]MBO0477315.1 NTP transferase domain-containing protein [Vagococcus sp. DIV0080]
MNVAEKLILQILFERGLITQREISDYSSFSLGKVNKIIRKLVEKELILNSNELTQKAKDIFENSKVENAIILAAGPGIRMIPINSEESKGLLEINGEKLIERQIMQLHEVGIKDITVVVGYKKESYEYLIDKYSIQLVVNRDYLIRNNLFSLSLVKNKISNTYIIPCDVWFDSNPFSKSEICSWYMISDEIDRESQVKENVKKELVHVKKNESGNKMIGLAYISKDISMEIKKRLLQFTQYEENDQLFWEEVLFENSKMIVPSKLVPKGTAVEINTYEDLRNLDSMSNNLKNKTLEIIATELGTSVNEIYDIELLKKGMTNRSFIFKNNKTKYIMRIPGEGTDKLINRIEEASIYSSIKSTNISDELVYINPETGFKLTKFIENARCCNPESYVDIKKCMDFLRGFHELNLVVDHVFDPFEKLEFYEKLWSGVPSGYSDYIKTKENVMRLKKTLEFLPKKITLSHIDSVPDNFLFYEKDGIENIKLIDWEYAAMCDPHIDIAMFCIYSMFEKQQVDETINLYFNGMQTNNEKIKVYCYISVCGLLWSNWCEYKRNLGVEFGEYSLRQYRFAKDYFNYVIDEIDLEVSN